MTDTIPPPRSAGEHLEAVAGEVARLASDLVRASFGRATALETKSSPTDIVTRVDLQSEALIRRELLSRCPGSTIVGEELADAVGSNAVGWVVDPIDGTVNFLYGLPVVSVSIAATVEGVTVAGAVVDVASGETFSAALGHGARSNGAAIEARSVDGLHNALVGTGFSYAAERRREQSSILNRLLPSCRDIRCMGSAALNLCWVASGRLDAYYEHDTKPYDYEAGALIAAEAGAEVELPADNARDLTVAGHRETYRALRRLIMAT